MLWSPSRCAIAKLEFCFCSRGFERVLAVVDTPVEALYTAFHQKRRRSSVGPGAMPALDLSADDKVIETSPGIPTPFQQANESTACIQCKRRGMTRRIRPKLAERDRCGRLGVFMKGMDRQVAVK